MSGHEHGQINEGTAGVGRNASVRLCTRSAHAAAPAHLARMVSAVRRVAVKAQELAELGATITADIHVLYGLRDPAAARPVHIYKYCLDSSQAGS